MTTEQIVTLCAIGVLGWIWPRFGFVILFLFVGYAIAQMKGP